MSSTERLKLPFLSPGQAQKEWLHNEALQILDCVAAACVEAVGVDTPPATPAIGASWLIGSTPTGAWAGKGDHVATMTASGWRFVAPVDGLSVTVRSSGLPAQFRSGGWHVGVVIADRVEVDGIQVISSQAAAIADPAGGTTIDSEARTALAQILAALRGHGLIAGS